MAEFYASTSTSAGRYRLHGSPDSANFVVRMVLEELGAGYDYLPVDRSRSEQKSAAYRQLNPQGLIPVLEAPGQDAPLFETGAILLFLADAHRALAPSPESAGRGRFLKWLFFISNTLHADLRISFKPKRYVEDPEKVGSLLTGLRLRIDRHFQLLDDALAERDGPFLLGLEITCADIYLAACARWAQIYSTPVMPRPDLRSRLFRLLATLEERPALRRACDLELIDGSPFISPEPVTFPGATA